jgi:hypothetical protein
MDQAKATPTGNPTQLVAINASHAVACSRMDHKSYMMCFLFVIDTL